MSRFTIGLAAAVALAAAAVATATAGAPTTGAQIALGTCAASPCESTYPASTPFFIRHGYVGESREFLLDPGTRFDLTVDGTEVPGILDLDLANASKLYVTNFRFGMTGTHTFTGCWYGEGELAFCGTRTVTFVS